MKNLCLATELVTGYIFSKKIKKLNFYFIINHNEYIIYVNTFYT